MRLTKGIFLIVVLITLPVLFPMTADADQDILPLGPSAYKYIIDKIEKDQIMDTSSGKTVTLADIVAQTPDTEVYVIGEAHDNYQCHTFQRDFIETLYKKYPKIVVGFEFFWRQDNDVLEQWRKGEISEEELIKKTEWYKRGAQNYGYTRLIMEIIQKYHIKTIGLNVPREILHTVSRKGFDQLTPEEKKLFPTINIPNPEHEYFIKSIFGTFGVQVPFWFQNIYAAQKCWDVIMAESMRQILAQKEYKGYKGVIIAGSNHVAYSLGIPFRYKKANPKTKITTVVPILIPEEKKEDDSEEEEAHPMMKIMGKSLNPAAVFSRGIADYVFSADKPLDSHFPVIGFTVEDKEGKFMVTRVSKDSIAEKNGVCKSDQITTIDNLEITSMEQLRLLVSQKNWDDTVSLGVIKSLELTKNKK